MYRAHMVRAVAAAVLLIPVSVAVRADTYRCGNGLVSEESTVAEILAKCGQPTSKDVREVQPTARSVNGTVLKLPPVKIEVWTYTRSPGLKVTIMDGKVESIEPAR